ncbi:MAG: hypothetical protein QW735_01440 [archaeon]
MSLQKSFEYYLKNLDVIFVFSFAVLYSLTLLPFIESYVTIGSGFIRFSSIYLDFSLISGIVIAFFTILTPFFLAAFCAAMISIVKLQETYDHVGFARVLKFFQKYLKDLFIFFLFIILLTISVGVFLTYLHVPYFFTQLIIFLLWLPLLFAPQIMVMDDFGLEKTLKDSLTFFLSSPIYYLKYLVVGLVLLFLAAVFEVFLGFYFVWEHKIFSLLLTAFFIVPFLQIYASVLYLNRYPIVKVKTRKMVRKK